MDMDRDPLEAPVFTLIVKMKMKILNNFVEKHTTKLGQVSTHILKSTNLWKDSAQVKGTTCNQDFITLSHHAIQQHSLHVHTLEGHFLHVAAHLQHFLEEEQHPSILNLLSCCS
jgi:hypothetical protein